MVLVSASWKESKCKSRRAILLGRNELSITSSIARLRQASDVLGISSPPCRNKAVVCYLYLSRSVAAKMEQGFSQSDAALVISIRRSLIFWEPSDVSLWFEALELDPQVGGSVTTLARERHLCSNYLPGNNREKTINSIPVCIPASGGREGVVERAHDGPKSHLLVIPLLEASYICKYRWYYVRLHGLLIDAAFSPTTTIINVDRKTATSYCCV